MNNATPERRHNDGDDAIRIERPEGVHPDAWREIVTNTRALINERVAEALGRCPDHVWCTLAGDPEHDEFHMSITVDLVDAKDPSAPAAAAAWLTQNRTDSRLRLVVDASGETLGGKHFELDIDARDAWLLLSTTLAGASADPGDDARQRILDLIEEATR